MKTFSITHPRGHGVRKLLGNFLWSTKLSGSNLRNATFRTWIVLHIYKKLLLKYIILVKILAFTTIVLLLLNLLLNLYFIYVIYAAINNTFVVYIYIYYILYTYMYSYMLYILYICYIYYNYNYNLYSYICNHIY